MAMRNAKQVLDHQFLEMRWRALSLAADLDRLDRAEGGATDVKTDLRLAKFRQAIQTLLDAEPNRAERVQQIFSDQSPPPAR